MRGNLEYLFSINIVKTTFSVLPISSFVNDNGVDHILLISFC